MGLNTGQLVSGAGVVAESRREHEGKLIDIQGKQLDIEARNRRVDPELRQRQIDRARKGLEGIDTTDELEVGKAPEPEKKAGLSTGSQTATATSSASTGTPTSGKAGLKTEESGTKTEKAGMKYGVDYPDAMKGIPRYGKDDVTPQGEDESNLKYGLRKIGSGRPFGAHRVSMATEGPHIAKFIGRIKTDTTSLGSTPARRREWGFNDDTELKAFIKDMDDHNDVIRDWFGEHIGSGAKFSAMSKPEQVQHIKAIIDERRKSIDEDSGLTKEAEAEAKSTAQDVKAAKKKAGLPATSAIEEKKPSKKRTALLMNDRGAPRDEALDLKNQYEELSIRMQEEIWVGDDSSQKNVEAIRKEMLVLKEAYDHALGVQGVQDFQLSGDPRMMQGVMSKKYNTDVFVQKLDNGNYDIVVRDKNSGELVPVHRDQEPDAVVASYRNFTDEGYKKAFQDIVAQRAKLQMEFDFDSAMEVLKTKLGMKRDQAKAFIEAQTDSASGEDVKMFNAKIDGNDEFVIQKGSRFFQVTPPAKSDKAGSTAPGMIEIDPPF